MAEVAAKDDLGRTAGKGSRDRALRHSPLMLIAVSALILFSACQQEVVVPQQLTGEWKTTAPQYADRYLKLSEQTVTYGIGEGQEVAHIIDNIKREQRDSGTVYTFYYRDAEGQKDFLTVTYSPEAGGTLQIKNTVEIWRKTDAGQTE